MGFADALKIHLTTVLLILQNSHLFRWYLRIVGITLVSSGLLVGLFWGLGGWGIWTALGGDWIAGVATVLWLVGLFFVAGILVSTVLNLFMSLFASERGMRITLKIISSGANTLSGKSQPKMALYRWQELKSLFLSLFAGLTGWPLIVIPVLIPIGICVFSYVLGRETYDTAVRVFREEKMETPLEMKVRPPFTFFILLGLPAAICSFFPLIGWVVLPSLRVAGVLAVRSTLGKIQNSVV